MLRRKETKIERQGGRARPFQPLSRFLAATNTCPVEGGSPDAGGQLRGDGRPLCMRSGPRARGGGWRAVAEEQTAPGQPPPARSH